MNKNKTYKTSLNIWTSKLKDYIANDLVRWGKFTQSPVQEEAIRTIALAAMTRFQVELLKQALIKNVNPDDRIAFL